ncbi:hypothetical protein E2C01_015479 [Portunus trituberculatus]|uniref:Uncharacterized protein n=1 Tax=Portunus trituberculatus TaxID=210409 RepID=A0A5B7DN62_PORTR|nr:hypothetical protein [Portunus trituberculatus]
MLRTGARGAEGRRVERRGRVEDKGGSSSLHANGCEEDDDSELIYNNNNGDEDKEEEKEKEEAENEEVDKEEQGQD